MIVKFYKKENGEIPVADFLDSLPKKLSAKTSRTICAFEEKGFELGTDFIEKLDDDIWQLRTIQSSDITRVLFFFFDEKKVILTNGFVKKTNKTPLREIRKAKKYRKDYIRRHDNEKER